MQSLDTFSILGFILAIAAILLFPSMGFVFGIPAIILGFLSRKKLESNRKKKGIELAEASIIVGVLSIVLQILVIGIYFGFIAVLISSVGNFEKNSANMQFDGRLSVQDVWVGIDWGEYCAYGNHSEFMNEDAICFNFVDAEGFEKDKEGYNRYDADLKIWGEDGRLINYDKNILDTEEANLKNNVLAQDAMSVQLSGLASGRYTFELILYDLVSKKVAHMNKTIEIKEKIEYGSLEVQEFVFGLDVGDRCSSVGNNIFTTSERLCYYAKKIRGVEPGRDGFHWYDMKIMLRDEKNNILDITEELFGDGGHAKYQNNLVTDNVYGFLRLDSYDPGEYVAELTVYDKISRKSTPQEFAFVLKNDRDFGELEIRKVFIGIDNGAFCQQAANGTLPSSASGASFCIEPLVQGFVKNKKGMNWFDVDLMIIDSSGNVVESIRDVFGENGENALPMDIMEGYYVYFGKSGHEPGEYRYEITVYDRISKKSATAPGEFRVDDNNPMKSKPESQEIDGGIASTLDFGVDGTNSIKTFTISGIDYETQVVSVDAAASSVSFMINGETIPPLAEGQSYVILDGTEPIIRGIFRVEKADPLERSNLTQDPKGYLVGFALIRRN